MAKIKSRETLQSKLDEDSSWRKKELALINSRIKRAAYLNINTEIRIGIVMLYAHWEGFTKNAFDFYYEYVTSTNTNFKGLSNNFKILEVEKILNSSNKKSLDKCQDIVLFFNNGLNRTGVFKEKTETKSNLNFDRFSDLLFKAGFNQKKYNLKRQLIDEKLVSNRNKIAHGNFSRLDKNEFDMVQKELIQVMETLKIDILNSVSLENFKI